MYQLNLFISRYTGGNQHFLKQNFKVKLFKLEFFYGTVRLMLEFRAG